MPRRVKILASILFCVASLDAHPAETAAELVDVRKIWSEGKHNAFTDLIRFRERWWCCFREADGHVGGDGRIRVLESADGNEWQSAALIAETGIDLRDAKLSITPDTKLMLVAGGSVYGGTMKLLGRQPRVAFSADGRKWSATQRVLGEGDWLWRVTWHEGRAYGVSYNAGESGKSAPENTLKLYSSTDGVKYELITQLDVPGKPNETTLRFLKTGEMMALVRREAGSKKAWLGTSRAPYREWKWKELEHQIGGPNFIELPDGSLWAGGRSYPGGAKTVVAKLSSAAYEPVLTLPSGGDCSYPGLVWHDGLLWVSYYSSHEGKSSIYLAKVKLAPPKNNPAYRLQLDVISDGYDGKTCWFHPRAGAIPGEKPVVVLTMQKLLLGRSDVFYPIHSQESADLGRTWSAPIEHADTLGRRPEPEGVVVGVCDFTPKWHAASGKLIGTGHTVRYKDDRLIAVRPREPVWSVYDARRKTWSPWAVLKLPNDPKFWNAGAGSTQRVDLDNGDMLLPIYFKRREDKAYATTVLRCRFEGEQLKYIEHGSEHSVNIDRGLYEPSLAKFGGKFYLTMRNDRAGYVAVSEDGLKFDAPRIWKFEDGVELGNYNTQQHWVTHGDALYLSYTRRGANNDGVFRHRAPLFLAQVDTGRLVILRATERELVPNKGAQLGNFAVVDVSERETWVTTSEGMAPAGAEKHGANGRVYAARILWEKPNGEWNRH